MTTLTTVYSVMHAEGVTYVPTKEEALSLARAARGAGDLYVSVSKCSVSDALGRRQLYCALLNGESWAAGQVEVEL